ncbi:MAG: galactose oxidase [Thaumarchaeota archaeon]|nr:galactose oxidase [Nitrososphaerota archaeon]MCL5317745.1 galactose oxidase [Nitrososphaerota archaeon]
MKVRGDASLILLILPLLLGLTLVVSNQQSAQAQTPYHWIILPPMPTPRTEVTSAVIGTDVYVIGGAREGAFASDKVEIFNMQNRSWRSGLSLPTPLHHAVAVTFQGKIYVLGGYLDGWIPVNTTYIYDPANHLWSEGPRMPRAKAAFTAQVVDNRIYTFGGATAYARIIDSHLTQQVLNTTEYYDAETGLWNTGSPLPTPREHLASAEILGKVYVIGGRALTLESNSNINEEYDPKTDTWTEKAPMPTARGGIAAATIGARIFVFGGEAPTGTYNAAEMYNPAENTWVKIDPMPTARHGLTAQVVRGGILVVGGGPQPGFTYSGANEFLDPSSAGESTSPATFSDTKLTLGNVGLLIMLGAGIIILMVVSMLLYLKRPRTG